MGNEYTPTGFDHDLLLRDPTRATGKTVTKRKGHGQYKPKEDKKVHVYKKKFKRRGFHNSHQRK